MCNRRSLKSKVFQGSNKLSNRMADLQTNKCNNCTSITKPYNNSNNNSCKWPQLIHNNSRRCSPTTTLETQPATTSHRRPFSCPSSCTSISNRRTYKANGSSCRTRSRRCKTARCHHPHSSTTQTRELSKCPCTSSSSIISR